MLVLPMALVISAQMAGWINTMENLAIFFSIIMFASGVTIAVCMLCRTIYIGPIGKNVMLRSALLTACAAFHTAQGLAIAVMTFINPPKALVSWIFCATPWIAGLLLTSVVFWFDGRQRGSGT